jgi:hypothetical protein
MKRIAFALFGAAVTIGSMSGAAGAAPGGNSAAAAACQQGGYASLVGTEGGFTNVGQCVSYAARGGVFVTPGAGEFLVPAGQTLTLSDTVLSACNDLTYGYEATGGTFTVLGGKDYGCVAPIPQVDATIGPFPTAVIVRLVLVDNTCDQTYDSTGGHALVTGSNPYDVEITDAGAFCEAPEGTVRPPGPAGGNLSTTLTVA